MSEMTISVRPVEGGWTVQSDFGAPTHFLSGGRAEAHAQRLGRASWQTGAPALVLVHDRCGERVGTWRFGLCSEDGLAVDVRFGSKAVIEFHPGSGLSAERRPSDRQLRGLADAGHPVPKLALRWPTLRPRRA